MNSREMIDNNLGDVEKSVCKVINICLKKCWAKEDVLYWMEQEVN